MPEITKKIGEQLSAIKTGLADLCSTSQDAAEGDALVAHLAQGLLDIINAHEKNPICWKIGGAPILLQEFLMPILDDLNKLLDTIGLGNRGPVTISSCRIPFDGNRNSISKNDQKHEDGGNAVKAIQDKTANFVLVSTKNHYPPKGRLAHNLSKNKITPTPCRTKAAGGTGNKFSHLEVGKFDYKIYMHGKVQNEFKNRSTLWSRNVPLISPKHCPANDKELSEITTGLGFTISHNCPDINSAVAALRSDCCPYAAILPSYISQLRDPAIISIDIPREIFEGRSDLRPLFDELHNHSITLVWQFSHFIGTTKDDDTQFPKGLGELAISILELIANNIETKIPRT